MAYSTATDLHEVHVRLTVRYLEQQGNKFWNFWSSLLLIMRSLPAFRNGRTGKKAERALLVARHTENNAMIDCSWEVANAVVFAAKKREHTC